MSEILPDKSLTNLGIFLMFLDNNKMIDLDKITDDTDEGFTNRLKIQKYVYLSKYFGWDLKYDCNAHLHGVYSTELSIHYNMIGNSKRSYLIGFVPSDGNQVNFTMFFADKDEEWLELATTLLIKKGIVEDNNLFEYVLWLKPEFSVEEITNVDNDLKNSHFFEYT